MIDGKIDGLQEIRRIEDCVTIEVKGDEAIVSTKLGIDNVRIEYDSNINYFGKRHPTFTFTAEHVIVNAHVSVDKLTGELLPERCKGRLVKVKKFRVKIKNFGTFVNPIVNLIARFTRTEIKRLVETYIDESLGSGFNAQ